MSCIKRALCLLWYMGPVLLLAQEDFTGYLEPALALNYQVTPTYSHNFSFSPRIYFRQEGETGLRTRHMDLRHFSSVSWGPDGSVGFGILYRFRDNFEPSREDELRLTQQVNFTSRPGVVRMGHRLRAQQRIQPSRTVHRFRYRFALDGPLEGDKLDVGEAYWIGSLESLLSVGKGIKPQHDIRATSWVGYLWSEGLKIQGGAQYRQEDYTGNSTPVLFFLTSLIVFL